MVLYRVGYDTVSMIVCANDVEEVKSILLNRGKTFTSIDNDVYVVYDATTKEQLSIELIPTDKRDVVYVFNAG